MRSSLLAILTMGPAYGFQLHGELQARTAGRRSVNVGQIYSTLERLTGQGVVESAGSTPDGLPLYRLTVVGRAEAMDWLHATSSPTGDDWDEMLERVLIASSLPHIDLTVIIRQYREAWSIRASDSGGADSGGAVGGHAASGQSALSAVADSAQALAAVSWLDSVSDLVQSPAGNRLHRELSLVRPRRGRRPTLTGSGAA
ncbi:helix-turn-helix transcriptional regulator [Cryobacterium sp. SO2]|uniref:PadR family transcriptional regulator n=1 Tax=Cryobacterium sp. SO2 TaxID=1897060 RepID=UPI00223DA226|nr:helix-turn-helix transcriptional regulator [Cryobacterium sp. SO2]WEO79119.1 helix-turn-helix transcriptional regulator [Cryobacterium sp. SO2]